MKTFDAYLSKKMDDPEFREEYEALEPEFTIIQAMIDAQKSSGITKEQLAERTGIKRVDISKLENGDANPSLSTLKRLASGMDMRLKIEFLPAFKQ